MDQDVRIQLQHRAWAWLRLAAEVRALHLRLHSAANLSIGPTFQESSLTLVMIQVTSAAESASKSLHTLVDDLSEGPFKIFGRPLALTVLA